MAHYAEQFMKELRAWSVNKDDPITEWELYDNPQEDETDCICGKDIHLRWPISNTINHKILWIGSDCAERWLNPTLACKGCNRALGQVMKRRKEKNYFCRSCLLKDKKEKEKRIATLSKFRFRNQRFDELSLEVLEYFYNSGYESKTIQYLKEYVELTCVIR